MPLLVLLQRRLDLAGTQADSRVSEAERSAAEHKLRLDELVRGIAAKHRHAVAEKDAAVNQVQPRILNTCCLQHWAIGPALATVFAEHLVPGAAA